MLRVGGCWQGSRIPGLQGQPPPAVRDARSPGVLFAEEQSSSSETTLRPC